MSSKIGCGISMSSSSNEGSPCRSSVGSNRDLVSSNSSMEVFALEGGGFSSSVGNCLVSMENSGFPLSASFFYWNFLGFSLLFRGKYPNLVSCSARAGVGFTVILRSGGGLNCCLVLQRKVGSLFPGIGISGWSNLRFF